jgi:hypothetical protein
MTGPSYKAQPRDCCRSPAMVTEFCARRTLGNISMKRIVRTVDPMNRRCSMSRLQGGLWPDGSVLSSRPVSILNVTMCACDLGLCRDVACPSLQHQIGSICFVRSLGAVSSSHQVHNRAGEPRFSLTIISAHLSGQSGQTLSCQREQHGNIMPAAQSADHRVVICRRVNPL